MTDEEAVRAALPDVTLESHPYRDEYSACSPEWWDGRYFPKKEKAWKHTRFACPLCRDYERGITRTRLTEKETNELIRSMKLATVNSL